MIVAFGDSLTAGFGADTGKSYPDFLQQELDRRGYRYRVVNAGISGETTTDALARLSMVTALKAAVVIVEFGGNDGLRGLPVATTRANLDQILAALKQSGAQVLLAGMTLPPNYGPEYIAAFQGIYRDLAAKDKGGTDPVPAGGSGRHQPHAARWAASDSGWQPAGGGTVMRYLTPLLRK